MSVPARRLARPNGRAFAASLAAVALALGGVLVAPLSAQAATLTVTSSADSGAGSLRTIVGGAASGDTIIFDPSVTTIALASTVTLPKGVTIDGGGSVTITRANNSNFIQLYAVPDSPNQDYVFKGLSIYGVGGSTGQGIYATIGSNGVRDITLSDVTISAQTAPYGGGFGLFGATGDILIEDSFFNGNTSSSPGVSEGGGAVDLDNVAGSVTVNNSVFYGNSSASWGGALRIRGDGFTGSIDITDSAFIANAAATSGGAIRVDAVSPGYTVLIDSSAFSSNTVGGGQNGVSFSTPDLGGELDIVNSTFDEQASTESVIAVENNDGVIDVSYSTVVGGVPFYLTGATGTQTVTSSILQGLSGAAIGVSSPDDPVVVTYSILSSALAAFMTDAGGNQFSVADPKLGPLQDNGGPTSTRLPLAGSPAVNNGLPGGTPPTYDQRGIGFPRVIGGRVDVGATESDYPAAPLPATGQTINIWIPIIAGVLLLGGAAAITINVIRRRKLR